MSLLILQCFFAQYEHYKKGSSGSRERGSAIRYTIQKVMALCNVEYNDVVKALARHFKINDRERALWIDNDEMLHIHWKISQMSKSDFVKRYRNDITMSILLKAHL